MPSKKKKQQQPVTQQRSGRSPARKATSKASSTRRAVSRSPSPRSPSRSRSRSRSPSQQRGRQLARSRLRSPAPKGASKASSAHRSPSRSRSPSRRSPSRSRSRSPSHRSPSRSRSPSPSQQRGRRLARSGPRSPARKGASKASSSPRSPSRSRSRSLSYRSPSRSRSPSQQRGRRSPSRSRSPSPLGPSTRSRRRASLVRVRSEAVVDYSKLPSSANVSEMMNQAWLLESQEATQGLIMRSLAGQDKLVVDPTLKASDGTDDQLVRKYTYLRSVRRVVEGDSGRAPTRMDPLEREETRFILVFMRDQWNMCECESFGPFDATTEPIRISRVIRREDSLFDVLGGVKVMSTTKLFAKQAALTAGQVALGVTSTVAAPIGAIVGFTTSTLLTPIPDMMQYGIGLNPEERTMRYAKAANKTVTDAFDSLTDRRQVLDTLKKRGNSAPTVIPMVCDFLGFTTKLTRSTKLERDPRAPKGSGFLRVSLGLINSVRRQRASP